MNFDRAKNKNSTPQTCYKSRHFKLNTCNVIKIIGKQIIMSNDYVDVFYAKLMIEEFYSKKMQILA